MPRGRTGGANTFDAVDQEASAVRVSQHEASLRKLLQALHSKAAQASASSSSNFSVDDVARSCPEIVDALTSWLRQGFVELPAPCALQLTSSAAGKLLAAGHATLARDKFYACLMSTCATEAARLGGVSALPFASLSIWVSAIYASADVSLRQALAADPYAKARSTRCAAMAALEQMQRSMQMVVDLPPVSYDGSCG